MRICALSCAAGFALAGCATDPDDESRPAQDSSAPVSTTEQSLYIWWDGICADPGQTIWYTNARVRGQNVGGHITGVACVDPVGCVTSYHICDANGCGRDIGLPWPGDSICLND